MNYYGKLFSAIKDTFLFKNKISRSRFRLHWFLVVLFVWVFDIDISIRDIDISYQHQISMLLISYQNFPITSFSCFAFPHLLPISGYPPGGAVKSLSSTKVW